MRDDLRERREKLWNLRVVNGVDYGTVVERLSNEYDVSEAAIKKDMSRMDEWIGDLDDISHKSAASRMRELRKNRQRLQQMALEAREEGDLEQELAIRRQIDQAVKMDVELSQSLGRAEKEPDRHEVELDTDEALMASLRSEYEDDNGYSPGHSDTSGREDSV